MSEGYAKSDICDTAEDRLRVALWYIKKVGGPEIAREVMIAACDFLTRFNKKQEVKAAARVEAEAKCSYVFSDTGRVCGADARACISSKNKCLCGNYLCMEHQNMKCGTCNGLKKVDKGFYPIYVPKMHFEVNSAAMCTPKAKNRKFTTDLARITCQTCLDKMGVKQT